MTSAQQSMRDTFISLRIGIGIIGILFPFLLWGGGKIAGFTLRESMSAYYHANKACPQFIDRKAKSTVAAKAVNSADHQKTPGDTNPDITGSDPCVVGGGTLRNVFVGILFAVGTGLFLYRGFSVWENVALNVAGGCAFLIAVCPMSWSSNESILSKVHGTSALIFFACMAFVCAFCSEKTLRFVKFPTASATRRNSYRRIYLGLAIVMLLSPVLAIIFNATTNQKSKTFWMETFGIVAFGSFWLVKTRELSSSGIEKETLEGRVSLDRVSLTDPKETPSDPQTPGVTAQ